MVGPRLDYANAFLFRITGTNIQHRQRAQNSLARIVTLTANRSTSSQKFLSSVRPLASDTTAYNLQTCNNLSFALLHSIFPNFSTNKNFRANSGHRNNIFCLRFSETFQQFCWHLETHLFREISPQLTAHASDSHQNY